MNNKLKLVEEHFNKLILSYQSQGETYRENSFRTVIQLLRKAYYNTDIPTDLEEVRNLRGVGNSSITEIEHALSINHSDRLENIAKQNTDNKDKTNKDKTMKAITTLKDLKKLIK